MKIVGSSKALMVPASEAGKIRNRLAKYTDESKDGCWNWHGYTNPEGYALTTRNGKTVQGHRLAFAYWICPIPAGGVIAHRCDNPGCVRPSHLFLTDNVGNLRDRDLKGRNARGVRQGRSKLTDDDVRIIRSIPKVRGSGIRLAARFGVTATTISRVVKHRQWKHVTKGVNK